MSKKAVLKNDEKETGFTIRVEMRLALRINSTLATFSMVYDMVTISPLELNAHIPLL